MHCLAGQKGHFQSQIVVSAIIVFCPAHLSKKRLDRVTYCLHAPKFDRRHLGQTTLQISATALGLRSKDYESKTYKPLVENPCYYPSHRCFIDTFTNEVSQQSGLTKMAAVNFLASKMKQQKLDPVSFLDQWSSQTILACFAIALWVHLGPIPLLVLLPAN